VQYITLAKRKRMEELKLRIISNSESDWGYSFNRVAVTCNEKIYKKY